MNEHVYDISKISCLQTYARRSLTQTIQFFNNECKADNSYQKGNILTIQ